MNLLVRDGRGAFGRQPWGVALTLGTGGFPTVTRVFHRCNAGHRIKVWDGAPEGWTDAGPSEEAGPGPRAGLTASRAASYSDRVPPSAPEPTHSGMPAAGEPEDATLLRRVVAVIIDWLLCQLIAIGLLGVDVPAQGASAFVPLGVFALENLLLVTLVGSTIGHRILGLQVWQVRPGTFPLQVLVRTALLCLFVPAVLSGKDGRGLHDVAAGTRIVRV